MAIPQPTAAPVVHMVPIRAIKKATWNPKNRTSERRLLQLRLSMDDLGLYYPVLIDEKNSLIDGHRRLAVAESFGWTVIPAITVKYAMDQSYGSVQLTQQKLTGNDILGVYLVAPNALIGTQRSGIANAEKVLGSPLLRLIYDAGMSAIGVLANARRAAKYIKSDEVVEIAKWIVRHRLGFLGPLIKGGIPPTTITKAFKANKPILIA